MRARGLAAELERIGRERLTELTWKLTGDLFHVAYAKELTAGAFISFDDEQLPLAEFRSMIRI